VVCVNGVLGIKLRFSLYQWLMTFMRLIHFRNTCWALVYMTRQTSTMIVTRRCFNTIKICSVGWCSSKQFIDTVHEQEKLELYRWKIRRLENQVVFRKANWSPPTPSECMLSQLEKREFDFYFYLLFYFPFPGTAHKLKTQSRCIFIAFFRTFWIWWKTIYSTKLWIMDSIDQ